MDQYGSEEEQVEALRRWWQENGTTTIAAIVIALASGFGWQAWTANQQQQQEQASDVYQAMLRSVDNAAAEAGQDQSIELAEQLKSNFSGTTYAQFAALHLAALAVKADQLPEAEAQLRWVLGKADKGSDTAQVAQLRLARVLAASGDSEQALAIIAAASGSAYRASYAVAQGDILLADGRRDEAREAYGQAMALASAGQTGINLPALEQKLQSLTPVSPVSRLPAMIDSAIEKAAGSELVEQAEKVDAVDELGPVDELGENVEDAGEG